MSDMPNVGIPAPGSKEAIDAGCSCPVLDNRHGLGYPHPVTGEPVYWINEWCPLHALGSAGKGEPLTKKV